MRCYRRILRISYKDHVTNEKVCAKIQQAIGLHEDLLTIVDRRKCSGMVISSFHKVWPKPSCKAQWKGEEDKADKGRSGKTTSGNGQAWSSASPRGQWRTGKMEKTGYKIICGAPTTLAVKGLMIMMKWMLPSNLQKSNISTFLNFLLSYISAYPLRKFFSQFFRTEHTDKVDRGRGGKTTPGNGQAWSLASPKGQLRTGKNG